ncbi:MAG: hypothetical protein ACE5OZ_21245 [Candidatus Heimdallarchaeota archaeon]
MNDRQQGDAQMTVTKPPHRSSIEVGNCLVHPLSREAPATVTHEKLLWSGGLV